MKTIIRKLLNFFHIDLTRNLKYDRLTKSIIKKGINISSNCIDVGCHKGEMLELMIKLAPQGKHIAFEPIPTLFEHLRSEFSEKAVIYPYALSDKNGESTFQHVKNAQAYSGINKRKYDITNPDIEEIRVEIRVLDQLLAKDFHVDFIKIDVEGGEYHVLKGAKDILQRCKPLIVFEFGLGASDYYGVTPEDIFSLLTECQLNISTLKAYVKNKPALNLNSFKECYSSGKEYYFVAHS